MLRKTILLGAAAILAGNLSCFANIEMLGKEITKLDAHIKSLVHKIEGKTADKGEPMWLKTEREAVDAKIAELEKKIEDEKRAAMTPIKGKKPDPKYTTHVLELAAKYDAEVKKLKAEAEKMKSHSKAKK